ncbi:hypothetical protein NUU61_001578 [Penicillium alfredii]|uniref:Uncharacterized protein n=1 Tax=Penicillium alfredii TaxID=1506179 RepID=A0A9W9G455_9EURO|nr:uncharacterized protein NUU61_001624 [Penicillium alfredii]XP_056515145.1 uncharacterized protein NUU61_001296 [Penicillium alfredii]XP_056515427.1 uncharacterized protein NUU61_001578 [Penicillium alfredii]KAJ5110367.1 hypothetical protein NUU61_001624 [Penicillium alfredii]KAJ5111666.1 hypothetical protein NUU61_001296 [Penicillium alfredii]KAJ5111948.1 hypothetical protein NUU61_001578 [Penicillium alfredii]
MMNVFCLLLIIGLAFLQGALSEPEWNDVDGIDRISAARRLQWPDDCNPSYCTDFEMDETLQEAALLTYNARRAIDVILGTKTDKVVAKNSRNERFLQAAKALFHIDYGDAPDNPKMWAVAQDKRFILFYVKEFFDRVYQFLKQGGVYKPKMLCGDEDIKFVTKMKEIGGRPPDEPIWKAKNEDKKTTPGWYISNFYSPKDKEGNRIEDRVVRIHTDRPICRRRPSSDGMVVEGQTFRDVRVIVLCNHIFGYKELEKLIRDQKRLAVGTSLDTQDTRGAVWLHEYLHYISPEMTDQEIDVGTGKQRAYDVDLCMALARKSASAKEARDNPENYVKLATAVSLRRVKWFPSGKKAN